jgi:hypothetical protein
MKVKFNFFSIIRAIIIQFIHVDKSLDQSIHWDDPGIGFFLKATTAV